MEITPADQTETKTGELHSGNFTEEQHKENPRNNKYNPGTIHSNTVHKFERELQRQ